MADQEDDVFAATEDESADLEYLFGALEHAAPGAKAELRLEPEGEPITVPAALLPVIARAARELALAHPIAIVRADAELTIEEAADLLVQDPAYVSRLIGSGEIPYHDFSERRVSLRDVLKYQLRRDRRRAEGLQKLTRLSEEYGLYDKT